MQPDSDVHVYPDDYFNDVDHERTYYDVCPGLVGAEYDSATLGLEHVGTYDLCSDNDWAVYIAVVKRLGAANVRTTAIHTGIAVVHRRIDR